MTDNVAAPVTPDLAPAPLPAETGSIESPVAPTVDALVEPERIALPQLPPPPLAQEPPQRPAAIPGPSVPDTASAPLPEPPQLADQPLPSSALPASPAVEAAPLPPGLTPADSAAAAAIAIADPAPPLAPVPPPPAVLPPAIVPPPAATAEISPIPPEPMPDVAATPPAEPTIDTIAFDLTGTVVAGDGPQGAIIQLYVDTELAGEGQVLDGRWEVFGAPLFAAPLQTLRAVAVDPDTGRVLGETEISIELELPESAAPPLVEDTIPQRSDRVADVDPAPEQPAPKAPDAAPVKDRGADLAADATADFTADPEIASPLEVTAPARASPKVLPPLRTVVPRGETISVTILPDSRSRLVDQPGSGFAILED
jgi:hypothetical protein